MLGRETTNMGILKMDEARKRVVELSERYKFKIDPDAYIEDITVGMQQRVEILKMLYCDNEILIFDEPTAVLTPQEISELMKVMKQLVKEGKSIIFITHKLNEIKEVADRCSVLRKGKYIGTIDVAETSKEAMSEMMVGRKVNFIIEKQDMDPGDVYKRQIYGGVAQLGEHLPCKQGVKSSNLSISICVHRMHLKDYVLSVACRHAIKSNI